MQRLVAYLLVLKYVQLCKLISSSTSALTSTFSYDNNGNTIAENSKQYVYNQNQRLIKAVEDSKVLGEY